MVNKTDQELFDELTYYTLSHSDPSFIHQHIVDAYRAQHADIDTKPIGIAFALIGLYLFLEKNFTGRQVQLAHMKMGRFRKKWPEFALPEARGKITVADVVSIPPGKNRDVMIRKWCASVWKAWSESRQKVMDLTMKELGL